MAAMVIVVGVTGGIAAYKAVQLVRLLIGDGHEVHVVPTQDALRFVGLPTWESISRNKVTTSVHDDVAQVRHVAGRGVLRKPHDPIGHVRKNNRNSDGALRAGHGQLRIAINTECLGRGRGNTGDGPVGGTGKVRLEVLEATVVDHEVPG